jgi:hypothetical protein
VRLGVSVDNLLDRNYFNQEFINRDKYVPGGYYSSGNVAAPRSVVGTITVAF